MGFKRNLLSALAVLFALYMGGYLERDAELPKMEDGWWGRGPKQPDTDESINPFTVSIPDAELEDLELRLASARLGEDLEDNDFHYGFQVGAMKNILEHWKDSFDWRTQEKLINQFPQFKSKIEGIDIHFWRVQPQTKPRSPRTLLMVHGWPGSVWEFYKIIPMLTAQGFEVICPSIPGYGFSERPHQKGFDALDTARVFAKLMKRLDIDQYYVQGGDWGQFVTTIMAQAYPERVLGVHVNMINIPPLNLRRLIKLLLVELFPSWHLTPRQASSGGPLYKLLHYLVIEAGYFHIQATKPDTVGFGLNDSPVSAAAYILEKFSTWTNASYKSTKDGNLEDKFTLDELLTNVMIYWWSGNIDSSLRYYKENVYSKEAFNSQAVPVTVPSGMAFFPGDLIYCHESLVREKFRHLVQYSHFDVGGHFAAFEEPELLASDIISFVEKVEKLPTKN